MLRGAQMSFISKSLKDTRKIAEDLVQKVRPSGACVIALYGDLGSGKTTFVQFFAKALGVKEKVLSPTFVIIKIFNLDARINADPPAKISEENLGGQARTNADKFGYKNLIHIDTYRLAAAKDLLYLGFKDLLKNKENIILIEWPEKIEKLLPKNTIRICFEMIDEKERRIVTK